MINEIGSRLVRIALLVAMSLVSIAGIAGCKFESQAIPATQLVVEIDAESGVRSRLDSLDIFVAGARHRDNLEDREKVFEEPVKPGADPESPAFPIRIVLTPKTGDARRVFELSATARDLVGDQVAQARVITGYVSHQIRFVRLVLEDDCIGVTCGDLDTCKVGGCGPAFVEPTDLPLLPGIEDAGLGTDGGDAAPTVDTGVDAGTDAAVDAGIDSGVDSGPQEDPCTRVDHGGCDPLVVCQTIDGVPNCGQCPNGYVDVNGNGSRCEDVDECKQPNKGGCDTEHGRCTNTPGGHDCSCETGFNGDGRVCTENVPCGNDPTVCDVLAVCQQVGANKVCQCKTGYEGDGARCTNVDECVRNLDDCPVHAACADTEGSFTCTCDSGYAKPSSGANQCVDVDECTANTDNCDDMPNACRNTDGAFMCVCPAGYTGSGIGNTCVDINECMLNTDNCDTNPDACLNDIGGFHCTCPTGYMGLGIGNTCVNIIECAMDSLNDCAAPPATCVDEIGGSPGYHCACPAMGYTGMGTDASPCADVDECSSSSLNNCNVNATCANTPAGSYTCTCKAGWMPATSTPGHGNGGCVNINECGTGGTNDCNANANCSDTQGSFTCACKSGFTPGGANPAHGTDGCTDTNECAPSGGSDCNANAACTNTPAGSFTCTCNGGFTPAGANPGHGAGGCTDTDECASGGGSDCNANAACTNTPAGSFTCTCGAGFTPAGANPGHGSGGCTDTNGCAGSPCLNGGTCADVTAPGTGHTCMCACGFGGANCETAATPTTSGLTAGSGGSPTVGLVAGTAYFQAIVLGAAGKLTALGVGNASGSGTVQMALYADVGSSPGARLATVGPGAVAGTYAVAGCTSLPMGTYWVGILSDQAMTIGQDGAAIVTRYRQDASGGLADPAGTVTTDANVSNLALFATTVP